VAQAQGDAQRFASVLTEYQKAPQVTKDRMYIDAMQQIYSNVTKVVVESRQGSNLLYLPLDKIMQSAANAPGPVSLDVGSGSLSTATSQPSSSNVVPLDARGRDAARSREREIR
jgi:membrane protease subunit HflK